MREKGSLQKATTEILSFAQNDTSEGLSEGEDWRVRTGGRGLEGEDWRVRTGG
jgi:hypothetical protein